MTKANELSLKGDIFLYDLILFTQEYLQTHNAEEVSFFICISSIDTTNNSRGDPKVKKE